MPPPRPALALLLALAACQADRPESATPPVSTAPPVPEPPAEPASRDSLGWTELRDGPAYAGDVWRWQYPEWAYEQVRGTETERDYDLWDESHLFMLQGDFDGDGAGDVAAWVERRSDPSEIAVVVVHRAGGVHVVPAGGPNWELFPRGPVEEGATGGEPPTLSGDALLTVYPETASVLWYWDGSAYAQYQQGD